MKNIILSILLILIIICIYFLISTNENFIFKKNNNKMDTQMSDKLTKSDIENLKKGQQIMTDMFRVFDKICRDNDIKYWCRGGTLIGAMRHKGWIPWDGDMDVGIMKNDEKKIKKIFEENKEFLEENGIFFSHPKKKPCMKLRSNKAYYIYTPWGNNDDKDKGIQIDIMIFKNIKNNRIYGHTTICGPPDKKSRPKSDVFPLKEIMFEDIKVYVPNEYKKISEEVWGAYPPKMQELEKRYPHEGRIIIESHNYVV